MAANRFPLKIPAGKQRSQSIQWDHSYRGCALEWNVVVLDGLLLDLKVSAKLHPQTLGGGFTFVILQEVKDGRTCRGSFEPTKDDRLLGKDMKGQVARAQVDEIVFEFNNTSWFTEKQAEIVTLKQTLGPPPPKKAKVPALPRLRPSSPLPRCDVIQKEENVLSLPQLLAPSDARAAPSVLLCKSLAAHLDVCLSVLEAKPFSSSDAGLLQELQHRVKAVQCFCDEMASKFDVACKVSDPNELEDISHVRDVERVDVSDATLQSLSKRNIEVARAWYNAGRPGDSEGEEDVGGSRHMATEMTSNRFDEELVTAIEKEEVDRVIEVITKDIRNLLHARVWLGEDPIAYCRYRRSDVAYFEHYCTPLHYAVHCCSTKRANAKKDKLTVNMDNAERLISRLLELKANPCVEDGWRHDVFYFACCDPMECKGIQPERASCEEVLLLLGYQQEVNKHYHPLPAHSGKPIMAETFQALDAGKAVSLEQVSDLM